MPGPGNITFTSGSGYGDGDYTPPEAAVFPGGPPPSHAHQDPAGTHTYNRSELVAEAALYLTFRAGVAIHRYYLPCVVVVGLIGNFLSLRVMLYRHNRRISCCVYMAFLAVFDNCNLVIGAYYWGQTEAFGRPLRAYECKIFAWLFHSLHQNSVLTIVFMTADRLIAIKCPLKTRVLCTPRRARISTACICAFSVIFNIPYVMSSEVQTNGYMCASFPRKSSFTWAYSWANTCLSCFLPFVVLAVMNGVMIAAIRRSHGGPGAGGGGRAAGGFQLDERWAMNDGAEPRRVGSARRAGSKSRQLAVMLLLVTFTFLALTLPQYLRYLTYLYRPFYTSPADYALYVLAAHASNKLYFTNNAVNVFLYALGGSKFRQDVKNLFRCCGPQREVTSTINGSI